MTWHRVAQAGEIAPGKPKIVSVKGKEIGIFHEGGRYFAILNFCPHAGAPICQGKVFGAVVAEGPGRQTYDHNRPVLRCPWHRWEFELETGQPLAPIRQRLKTYPVHIGECEPSSQDADGTECGGARDASVLPTFDVRVEGVIIWIKL